MSGMVIILMPFHKFEGECDGEKIKIVLNLHQDVSFRLNSGCEIVAGLVQSQLGYQTLTVEVNGKLAMRNRSRIVSHDKVEIKQDRERGITFRPKRTRRWTSHQTRTSDYVNIIPAKRPSKGALMQSCATISGTDDFRHGGEWTTKMM